MDPYSLFLALAIVPVVLDTLGLCASLIAQLRKHRNGPTDEVGDRQPGGCCVHVCGAGPVSRIKHSMAVVSAAPPSDDAYTTPSAPAPNQSSVAETEVLVRGTCVRRAMALSDAGAPFAPMSVFLR
jgi:hypothetical protein